MNTTVTKADLEKIGYRPHTAESVIRQAKEIMVKRGYPFYHNKRLGRVPRDVVESLLGVELAEERSMDGDN